MNEIIVTHVDPGETLSEIAARHGVSVDALQRWNRIEDPDLLQIGQRIVVNKAVDAPESATSEGAVSQAAPGPDLVVGSWDVWVGGAIVLALLLILFRRKRGAVIQPSSAPKANGGEPLVRLELMRHYRDWILLNDVLLLSGEGTTQIDVNGGAKLVHPGGAKLVHLTLCGTRCWGVVPVVHRRDPRCFV